LLKKHSHAKWTNKRAQGGCSLINLHAFRFLIHGFVLRYWRSKKLLRWTSWENASFHQGLSQTPRELAAVYSPDE
jgi:hypothetical protein